MSWYRTYRPRNIAGLHLVSVREQLTQLLKSGHIPQVLLLAGPKGSGKTSTARILASILNDPANQDALQSSSSAKKKSPLQEPDQKNEVVQRIQAGQSYAVQELDAASNRGIDEVRRLKEEAALPPQEGKVKVYILDEVHMFTTEAFNALLKLLEEPPAHVVFILATTELHKIPDTILSRSTLIPFHQASQTELIAALAAILEKEKISADEEALAIIAKAADGSFRDAVKIAENLYQRFGELSLTAVNSLEAGYETAAMSHLLKLVLEKNPSAILEYFEQLRSQQLNPTEFFKRWVEFLHAQLVANFQSQTEELASTAALLYLLKAMLQLPAREAAPIPFLTLEISLLEMVVRSKKTASSTGGSGSDDADHTSSTAPKSNPAAVKYTPKKSAPIQNAHPQPVLYSDNLKPVLPVTDSIVTSRRDPGDSQKLFDDWKTFITMVEKEHTGVGIILRSAKPLHSAAAKATIAVFYPFHKQCLEEPKTRQIIDGCIQHVAGGPLEVEIVVDAIPATTDASIPPQNVLADLAQDLLV